MPTTMIDEEYRLITHLKNHYYTPIILAHGHTWHCHYMEQGKPCPYGADMVACFKYHRVMKDGK